MSRYVAEYHYLHNQKYVPEAERFDDDTLEILLKELNDAYEDYFWDRVSKPNLYVPSYVTATPYETEKLLIDYCFVKDKKGKWKREVARKTYYERTKLKKRKWFVKSTDSIRLIETRHLIPKSYSYMKRTRKGISKPYPLRNLYWDAKAEGLDKKPKNVIVQKQKSKQIDLFDVGGCGCDFSQTDASACEYTASLKG